MLETTLPTGLQVYNFHAHVESTSTPEPLHSRTGLDFVFCPRVLCACSSTPLIPNKAGFRLGMRNGLVVAVPNPSPMSGGGDIDAAIRVALEEAEVKGLSGRDITPFVLANVNETTRGQSLKSNVALVSEARENRTRQYLGAINQIFTVPMYCVASNSRCISTMW